MAAIATEPGTKAAPAEPKAGKAGKDEVEPGTYKDLYRFADRTDLLLTFIGGVFASAGASVLPAFSLVFGKLMDSFDPRNAVNFLDLVNDLSVAMALVSAGSLITYWVQVTALKIASERQAVRIRREHFRAVLRQDVGWFDAQEATQLVSRLGDNAREMKLGMGHQAGLLINFTGTFIAGVGTGFYFSWRLTLTIVALVPAMAFIGAISMRFMTWTKAASAEAYAQAGGVAEEHLRAIRTVQTFGGEERAAAKYAAHALAAGEVGKRKGVIAGVGSGLTNGLMFIAFAVVFWVGGHFIAEDRVDVMDDINNANAGCRMRSPYDVGTVCVPEYYSALNASDTAACTAACENELVPCLLGDTCITGGIVMMVMFSVVFGGMMLGMAEPPLAAIAGGKTAARAVSKLMERTPAVDASRTDGATLDRLRGDIVFKGVRFTYPSRPEAPVLRGLDLHCEAGKTTAFCGASGCGKSTTIALLERFYDPQEGEVSIDGRDLRGLQLRWLRSQFGLVSQEPIVFADTIFNNIAFGHPEPASVTRDQVVAAAKSANAHDFISAFPDGYDTFVGQGGSSISGGQKQRIAIARAIIRDPAVLLLDEATSALDNESEKVVQAALDGLLKAKRRTTLVIAHRLTTIRNADKIVVFDAGRIVEEGTHEELAAKDGAYAALLRKQHGDADAEAEAGVEAEAASDSAAAAEMAIDAPASVESKHGPTADATAATTATVAVSVAAGAGAGAGADGAEDSKEGAATEASGSSKAAAKADEADEDATPDPMEGFEVQSGGRRLMAVGSSDAGWVAFGTVGAMVNGLSMPLFALIYAELTEAFYHTAVDEVREDTRWFSILYLIIAAVTVVTYTMQFLGYEIAGERLVARVRSMAFQRLMHLEMQFFDRKKNSAGAVSTRLSEEAATVRGLTGERLGVLATNIVTLTAGIAIALEASWKLTLVVIGLLPVVAFASSLELLAMGGDQSEQTDEKKELETAGRIMSESVHGIRTVQAFGLENILADVYGERLTAPYLSARNKAWLAGLGYGFSQCGQYGAMGLIFYIGGLWANDGDLTLNNLMRVMMGLLMSAMGAGQASALAPDVGKAAKASRALFRIIDFKPEIDTATEAGKAPESVRGDLCFRDVHFTYPTRASVPVLKGLTLDVKAGQTVALVGRSGCGKSTLMSLLLQFYRPQSGEIALDGVPLKDYNVKWLRSHCGVVSQEPVLIGDGGSTGSTIRQAIAYGAPAGKVLVEEQIVAAAKSANAHDFISAFPDGYDTVIGAGGMAMSGGQKQRIAIARAIIRDPAILLLDEATSALDTESERVVQAALDKLLASKGRTTLVIAHRLSTIKNADVIAVIDDGVVVESGTHAELLERDSAYAAQWRRGFGTPSASPSASPVTTPAVEDA